MSSRRDFQAYMRAAADQIEGGRDRCPTEAELIAYHQGRGNDGVRERIVSHLSVCASCRETLLDVGHFFDAAREEGAGTIDLDREWSRFQETNAAETRGKSNIATIGQASRRRPWRGWPALALAACLGVAMVSTAVWTFRTQRRLQDVQVTFQQRIQRLEEENRALRTRETELAQLNSPRLDAAIFDLFSRASLERSGGRPAPNRVRLAVGKPAVFILNGEGQPAYPGYAVEILDRQSSLVWRGEGLRRGIQGNYVVSFPPDFLREGEYRVGLFGVREGQKTKVGEYDLSVSRATTAP